MNKFKLAASNNGVRLMATTFWRIVLAILGSYITVSLFNAVIANLLAVLLDMDKATTFLWMMLLSFLFYSLLVLWVFASNKLLKTSLQLTVVIVVLFSTLQWVNHTEATPSELKS
ncbi:hypothetical protein [Pseudoalteromonas undina]|uniref:hypothetical protein n=1 Tax=Pseudoalteromonas TaxID=53246 RepID=UPI001866B96A|nr:hypothetical protein [Pseudoalteromonas undina]